MMSLKGKKHCRSLPPDVLTSLPDNVIDVILMCLPCKDAVRTSVLSKKWRYHWCRLTELTLDQSHWKSEKDLIYPTVKFTKIIYRLLTLHEGPITKFTLDIADLESCPRINNFICYLSRNGIQHLVLHFPLHNQGKLSSSLFRCSQLRHLTLHNCSIHPPSAFQGFDKLISMELCRVTISSEVLGNLISHCPLLEQLVLKISEVNKIEISAPMLRSFDFRGSISSVCLKNVPLLAKLSLTSESSFIEADDFDIAKFFESCSALEHLLLKFCCFEFSAVEAGEAPTRLPFDLKHVKRFHLPLIVLMRDSYMLSCVLCLIRSCPYLEYLEIKVWSDYDAGIVESLELERFSDVTFNHLKEVKLECGATSKSAMQLIKLLLAKSPVLVSMQIRSCQYTNEEPLDTRFKILTEISKFPHASPKANIDVVV